MDKVNITNDSYPKENFKWLHSIPSYEHSNIYLTMSLMLRFRLFSITFVKQMLRFKYIYILIYIWAFLLKIPNGFKPSIKKEEEASQY